MIKGTNNPRQRRQILIAVVYGQNKSNYLQQRVNNQSRLSRINDAFNLSRNENLGGGLLFELRN